MQVRGLVAAELDSRSLNLSLSPPVRFIVSRRAPSSSPSLSSGSQFLSASVLGNQARLRPLPAAFLMDSPPHFGMGYLSSLHKTPILSRSFNQAAPLGPSQPDKLSLFYSENFRGEDGGSLQMFPELRIENVAQGP